MRSPSAEQQGESSCENNRSIQMQDSEPGLKKMDPFPQESGKPTLLVTNSAFTLMILSNVGVTMRAFFPLLGTNGETVRNARSSNDSAVPSDHAQVVVKRKVIVIMF